MDAPTRFDSPVDHGHTAALLMRVQQGDERALDDLLRRYRDRVLRIARIRTGPELARRVEPDDIVQATFERAWKSFHTFDSREPSRLIDWLAVLAENSIRDQARRWNAEMRDPAKEERPQHSDDGSWTALPIAAGGATPSQHAVARETAAIYDRCLSELPVHQREVVLLRQFADMTWAETAERIGSPSAKAAVQLHLRALEALRLKLANAGVHLSESDESTDSRALP
jgi:RNA polymerase sigma-70 factor (ECF subfamily)